MTLQALDRRVAQLETEAGGLRNEIEMLRLASSGSADAASEAARAQREIAMLREKVRETLGAEWRVLEFKTKNHIIN